MRKPLTALLATTLGVSLAGPATGQPTSDVDRGSDAARVSAVIKPGTVLRAGAIRRSPNGKFQLQMQRDGNFVLYRVATKQPLWATDTDGRRRSAAVMLRDGNFVVYNRHRRPIFATTTHSHRGARMRVQNDGNIVIRSRSGKVLWTRWREVYQIWPRHRIRPGVIVQSPNHRHRLTMQYNGNLVLRSRTDGRWVRQWSSRTAGHRRAYALLGSNGDFVIYGGRQSLWHTNTDGNGFVVLAVQNDGNVVMYKRNGDNPGVRWQTHTAH